MKDILTPNTQTLHPVFIGEFFPVSTANTEPAAKTAPLQAAQPSRLNQAPLFQKATLWNFGRNERASGGKGSGLRRI